MIYLLGGHKNPAIRVIVGAVLLVAAVIVHGGAILMALGVVLVIWGGAQALKAHRISQRAQFTGDDGRMS
jgi:predicted phage tail protein